MERYLRPAAVGIFLVILQVTFIPFLALHGVVPDLLVILVVVFAIKRGQVEGMVGGFIVGIVEDLVTTHFFGLGALSKTVAGFVTGYFTNENKTAITLGTYRFLLILLTMSFLQNLVSTAILLQGSPDLSIPVVVETAAGAAVYTTAVGVLPMFAYSRRVHS